MTAGATTVPSAATFNGAFGFLGDSPACIAARESLKLAFAAASRSPTSAGELQPGEAIFFNPLHPHKSATLAEGLGPDAMRRLIFLTISNGVSSEGAPLFDFDSFMASCASTNTPTGAQQRRGKRKI